MTVFGGILFCELSNFVGYTFIERMKHKWNNKKSQKDKFYIEIESMIKWCKYDTITEKIICKQQSIIQISWSKQMNEIIFKRNHDRPQRIGYRNDVLFRATVHQGLKKRPRKKIYAGKLNEEAIYFFNEYPIEYCNIKCK